MSTPCPIRNFSSPSLMASRSASSAATGRRCAAGGGIFGQSAGPRMEHPRLQLARLFAGRHVACIEVDGVAAVAREGFCERRSIGPGPPQRLTRSHFDGQERQPDRDDLRCMPVGLDVDSRQREAGRGLFDGKKRHPLQRLRRREFGADDLALLGHDLDRHEARSLFEQKPRRRLWRQRRQHEGGADIGMACKRQLPVHREDAHLRVVGRSLGGNTKVVSE